MKIDRALLPVLAIAVVGVAGTGVSGCHVETQAKVGGEQPPPPPAAPPPPASTTAEAPPPPPPAPEPPKPEPPRKVIALKGVQMKSATQIDMPGDIEFQKASSKIVMNDKTKKVLTQLSTILKDNPEITKLSIEGNSDNEGENKGFDNTKLSEQRAQAVVEWLTKNGVDAKRLSSVGNGSKNPLAANDTPEHMAENRRVEFHVREFGGQIVNGEGRAKSLASGPPPAASAAVAPTGPQAADTAKKAAKKDKDQDKDKDKPK